MKIIHVLCEGQTELMFVNDVLKPYFKTFDIPVNGLLVTTNKKKNIQGGLVSFPKVQNDIAILSKSKVDNDYEKHIFTTMFDYYALPNEFPGYEESLKINDKYDRVEYLEKALSDNIQNCRLVPYIQLHEFEALVFCGVEYLVEMYPKRKKECLELKTDLLKVGNPELINSGVDTAPSKRIINAVEGGKVKQYSYNKPKTGSYVTSKIGIDKLRNDCRHFSDWIDRLLSL